MVLVQVTLVCLKESLSQIRFRFHIPIPDSIPHMFVNATCAFLSALPSQLMIVRQQRRNGAVISRVSPRGLLPHRLLFSNNHCHRRQWWGVSCPTGRRGPCPERLITAIYPLKQRKNERFPRRTPLSPVIRRAPGQFTKTWITFRERAEGLLLT